MLTPEFVVVATVTGYGESLRSVKYLKYNITYPVVNKDCAQPAFDPDRREASVFPTEKSAEEAMHLVASLITEGNQGTFAFTGLGATLVGMGMTVPPVKHIELSVQKIELAKLAKTTLAAQEDEGKKTLSINRYVIGGQSAE